MRKIICLSALVLLLCTGTALAKSKFEADLFFGSYQPSFSRVNRVFHINFKTGNIKGCSLAYQIIPDCKIHVQIDFSESKLRVRHPKEEINIRLNTTGISILSIVNFFQYQNYNTYGGVGLVNHRVSSWQPSFLDIPASSKHKSSFPWGTVVLIGLETSPNKSSHIKGEIQYVTGANDELFGIPLDWDGPKFLVSFGIKF